LGFWERLDTIQLDVVGFALGTAKVESGLTVEHGDAPLSGFLCSNIAMGVTACLRRGDLACLGLLLFHLEELV
jgi:hypothetical protein